MKTKLRIKGTIAVGVLALVSGILTTGFAGPAAAAGNPPWEPDPSSVGGLAFYNAAGQRIYSGNLTDSPIAAYVEGSSTVRAGDTVATLYGYLPVNGELPTQWSGEQLGQTTTYPNPSAPPPLNTATLPVETGNSGDETIATLEADFPNTDTTSDGYAHMYQLRLYTNAPRKVQTTEYDSTDILISGTKWWVVYPSPPLTILPTTLPKAKVGVLYSATLTAIGGTGTYTWSLATGSKLPSALVLSSAGVISGKPKVAGKFKFTVKVQDGTNTATQLFKLVVKT
jgi:hypothetical protein